MTDEKQKPGPKPDHLKIDEEDWRDAMKKAIEKPRPPEGWPRPDKDDDQEKAPE